MEKQYWIYLGSENIFQGMQILCRIPKILRSMLHYDDNHSAWQEYLHTCADYVINILYKGTVETN